MSNYVSIKSKIKKFNKSINVSGDKSISIRWVLFSSLAEGTSVAKNLLMSEDVLAAINAIKKFGIKTKINHLRIKDLSNKNLLSDEVGTVASIISKRSSVRKIIHTF